jgi:hypothetical protein
LINIFRHILKYIHFHDHLVLTTSDINSLFARIIDDLILSSRNDTKLAESIRWIDMQSQKNGISFYEMAYIISNKQITKKRAQEWFKTKELLYF